MECLYCGGDMSKHFIGDYDYEGEPMTMLRCKKCHKYEDQWLLKAVQDIKRKERKGG